MANRDVSLTPRAEEVREATPVVIPVQFDLLEIKNHFDESLESIIKQFVIADELITSGKTEEGKTIFRSQIVFLGGILDFYLHEMTKYGLYKMFLGDWPKTEKYKNFLIPMAELEKAMLFPESKEWFFAYVNYLFASVVMQDWETIRDQLNLLGVQWKSVCMEMYPTMDEQHAIGECKKLLAGLYKRRNVIAHQNDRDHAFAVQNDISKEYVTEKISKINSFVKSIHSVAAKI